jgi:hypothetical protein
MVSLILNFETETNRRHLSKSRSHLAIKLFEGIPAELPSSGRARDRAQSRFERSVERRFVWLTPPIPRRFEGRRSKIAQPSRPQDGHDQPRRGESPPRLDSRVRRTRRAMSA